jgi:16S rRNA (uracil1498-N3)-methyltransferase
MSLPYFFVPKFSDGHMVLDEDTSRHIVQVLRMKTGDEIMLTDGAGKKGRATILDDHKKRCIVSMLSVENAPDRKRKVSIAISLLKNPNRFEWFLEKATEIGVDEIIPMVTERTEKEKFRLERLQSILVSAMLQSQQARLPLLNIPTSFETVLQINSVHRFIAHCLPSGKKELREEALQGDALILIGPEGDFTNEEIESALQKGFVPVALGETRLRSETAGMAAAVLLRSN